MTREIVVVLYNYRLTVDNWRPPALAAAPQQLVAELARDYAKYGITVRCIAEPEPVLEVRGYADLLNTVRLRTSDPELGQPLSRPRHRPKRQLRPARRPAPRPVADCLCPGDHRAGRYQQEGLPQLRLRLLKTGRDA